jgi:hypothetical protein
MQSEEKTVVLVNDKDEMEEVSQKQVIAEIFEPILEQFVDLVVIFGSEFFDSSNGCFEYVSHALKLHVS